MAERSRQWNSNYSPIFNRDKLIRDYTNQLLRDLQMEIDEWGNNQLKNAILEPKIEYLDQSVRKEMDEIQYKLKFIERKINAKFREYLNFSIREDNFNSGGNSRFTDLLFGAGIGSGIGLILADLILPGVTIVSAGIFLIIQSIKGINNSIGNHEKIKMNVFEEGFKKFNESTEGEISGRISQVIDSAFSHRVKAANTGIKQIILSCENLLKQQGYFILKGTILW